MAGYRVIREYPDSPDKVWNVLTDPNLVPLWTRVGRGGRAEGFAPVPGNRFRFVARPIRPFWDGVVECEVMEVDPPRLMRYTCTGDEGKQPSIVTCTVEPVAAGTRLTWDHTDLPGLDGWVTAKLLGRVRRAMLDDPTNGFPAALRRVDDSGKVIS